MNPRWAYGPRSLRFVVWLAVFWILGTIGLVWVFARFPELSGGRIAAVLIGALAVVGGLLAWRVSKPRRRPRLIRPKPPKRRVGL